MNLAFETVAMEDFPDAAVQCGNRRVGELCINEICNEVEQHRRIPSAQKDGAADGKCWRGKCHSRNIYQTARSHLKSNAVVSQCDLQSASTESHS